MERKTFIPANYTNNSNYSLFWRRTYLQTQWPSPFGHWVAFNRRENVILGLG